MLVAFTLVLAVLVLVVLVSAGSGGGVRASTSVVGIDVFVLLVSPGVSMCRSYLSALTLVVLALALPYSCFRIVREF